MVAELAFTMTGVSTVLLPAEIVAFEAEKEVMATGAPTATEVEAVALSPAALVTVSVNVVLEARAPVPAATPLVTGPIPWSMLPVPPENRAVRDAELPAAMLAGLAVKDATEGAGTTVRVTERVRGPPGPCTVSVYVVVAAGVTM